MTERRDFTVRSQTEVTLAEQEGRSVAIPSLELLRQQLGEKVLPLFAKWSQEKILNKAEENALEVTIKKALQVKHVALELEATTETARLQGQATFFTLQVQSAMVKLFAGFGMEVQESSFRALEKWGEMMTENSQRIENNTKIADKYKTTILATVDRSGNELVTIIDAIVQDLFSRIQKARELKRKD